LYPEVKMPSPVVGVWTSQASIVKAGVAKWVLPKTPSAESMADGQRSQYHDATDDESASPGQAAAQAVGHERRLQ
jgi:hypothetical protein